MSSRRFWPGAWSRWRRRSASPSSGGDGANRRGARRLASRASSRWSIWPCSSSPCSAAACTSPWDTRYLSPLYVPLLLLLLLALDGLRDAGRDRPAPAFLNALPLPRAVLPDRWRLPAVAIGAALCLWVALMLPLTARGIVQANNGDFYLGAADARWVNSPTLRLAREAADGGPVLSTDAALLYLHAGIGKDANGFLPDAADGLEEAITRAAPGTLVVWIDKPWRDPPPDYGPADLRALPALEPLGEFADGAVFRVVAAPTP